MGKSNAERQREYRARRRESGVLTLKDRVAQLVEEVGGLQAAVRGLERRLQVVEDGRQRMGFVTPPDAPAERPGLGDLQARIDAVVTDTGRSGFPTDHNSEGWDRRANPALDPRTLTGPALRDYVRRYGPIPTDDPGDAA